MQQGFEVTMAASKGRWTEQLRCAGFRVENVAIDRRINPIVDLAAIVKLALLMRGQGFDIVHTHTSKAGIVGRLAAKAAGVPIVVHTVHGFPFHEGMSGIKEHTYALIERFAALFCDLLLSQSSEDIELASRYRICLPDKILYLGNGIDLDQFDPARVQKGRPALQALRKDFQIGQHTVLMIAELQPRKAGGDFLRAAEHVLSMLPHVRFLLVGDGPLKDRLEMMVNDLGLKGKVLMPGFRQDIPELLALTDVYVLSSISEGMPRSVIEAMAMGKPVVATNVRGTREVVEHGKTGLLVPARKPEALATAIVQVLQDKERATEMGQAGRNRAEKYFDENLVFERIESSYRRLLKQKGIM
jgi:glycosyltransferase involved in cell wall biosynthesis